MESTSCMMPTMPFVYSEMLEKTMLVPRLTATAMPMFTMKTTGSNHELHIASRISATSATEITIICSGSSGTFASWISPAVTIPRLPNSCRTARYRPAASCEWLSYSAVISYRVYPSRLYASPGSQDTVPACAMPERRSYISGFSSSASPENMIRSREEAVSPNSCSIRARPCFISESSGRYFARS